MRVALTVAGVASLIAAFAWMDGGAQIAEPTRETRRPAQVRDSGHSLGEQDFVLKPRISNGDEAQPFRNENWTPPPPSQPAQQLVSPGPAPNPVAPPLPFRMAGKLEQDGKTVYVLAGADVSHYVTQGDTINGTYKLVAAQERYLELLYLPLNEVQHLALPAP